MSDFITLTCKSCGGKLQITPEIENFACMYCGTEFQVKREGGIVALSPLVDEMKKVSVSSDKTASELAIIRLKEEISSIQTDLQNNEIQLNDWIKLQEKEIEKNYQDSKQIKFATFVVAMFFALLILVLFIDTIVAQNSITIIVIFGCLTAGIYFLLTWWNPLDIYKKTKVININNNVKLKSKELTEKKYKMSELITKKENEIDNYKKLIRGEV